MNNADDSPLDIGLCIFMLRRHVTLAAVLTQEQYTRTSVRIAINSIHYHDSCRKKHKSKIDLRH